MNAVVAIIRSYIIRKKDGILKSDESKSPGSAEEWQQSTRYYNGPHT